MNLTIVRALLEDSRQQVLDNKVFRLLVILTGIPILLTFVVAFHEDRMQILWGFDPIYYADIIRNFGGGSQSTVNLGEAFIQGFQTLIVSFFAGSLGVLFCIAATAFFMPRVLEKGAADTLFSKPVSRMAILLSRYVAGLLFIAGIAVVLVFGMFLGFGLRSGYWDAGFLWGAVTLVYLFGLMHAFSIFIAVLTRSSTAAILMTIVLFFITGRVHWGWETIQYMEHMNAAQVLRAAQQTSADGEEEVDSEQEPEEDEAGAVLSFFLTSVDVLHYTLPKTRDADIITNKLRRALTERAPELESEDGELMVRSAPLGFRLEPESVRTESEVQATWVFDSTSGATDGSVTVRRFERPQVERGVGAKKRMAPQTGRAAAKALKEELEVREDLVAPPSQTNESLGGVRAASIRWSEPGNGAPRQRERVLFHFGQWMYSIDFDLREGLDENIHIADRRRERFLAPSNMVLGQEMMLRQDQWYEREFGWTASWRYNILFSIGSSLAFVATMLSLAWLRLRRIDF